MVKRHKRQNTEKGKNNVGLIFKYYIGQKLLLLNRR